MKVLVKGVADFVGSLAGAAAAVFFSVLAVKVVWSIAVFVWRLW